MQLTVKQQEMLNHYLKLDEISKSNCLSDEGRCWVRMEMNTLEKEMGIANEEQTK